MNMTKAQKNDSFLTMWKNCFILKSCGILRTGVVSSTVTVGEGYGKKREKEREAASGPRRTNALTANGEELLAFVPLLFFIALFVWLTFAIGKPLVELASDPEKFRDMINKLGVPRKTYPHRHSDSPGGHRHDPRRGD